MYLYSGACAYLHAYMWTVGLGYCPISEVHYHLTFEHSQLCILMGSASFPRETKDPSLNPAWLPACLLLCIHERKQKVIRPQFCSHIHAQTNFFYSAGCSVLFLSLTVGLGTFQQEHALTLLGYQLVLNAYINEKNTKWSRRCLFIWYICTNKLHLLQAAVEYSFVSLIRRLGTLRFSLLCILQNIHHSYTFLIFSKSDKLTSHLHDIIIFFLGFSILIFYLGLNTRTWVCLTLDNRTLCVVGGICLFFWWFLYKSSSFPVSFLSNLILQFPTAFSHHLSTHFFAPFPLLRTAFHHLSFYTPLQLCEYNHPF